MCYVLHKSPVQEVRVATCHCTSTSHKARQRVKKKTVRQTARALDGIYTCMCGYIGLSTPIVYVGKHVVWTVVHLLRYFGLCSSQHPINSPPPPLSLSLSLSLILSVCPTHMLVHNIQLVIGRVKNSNLSELAKCKFLFPATATGIVALSPPLYDGTSE